MQAWTVKHKSGSSMCGVRYPRHETEYKFEPQTVFLSKRDAAHARKMHPKASQFKVVEVEITEK
jgi:hypothetical protein